MPGAGGMEARRRTGWAALLIWAVLPLTVAAEERAQAAEPPVREVWLHAGGSGRFEVVALAGPEGLRLSEWAAEAWAQWQRGLGLPARLPVAITVRLVPEAEWSGAGQWSVAAEPGGVVTVWIRGGGEPGVARERRWLRALAEGALRRKAILMGAEPGASGPPAWLIAAAAESVLIGSRPAALDAWQAALRDAETPRLREILLWDGSGGTGAAARGTAAHGVWLWLREEGTRNGAWSRFVDALLRGESAGAVLAREYARLTPRPAEAREWELAWRVAAARWARARTTPGMDVEESRRRLEALARVVVWDQALERERVLPPEEFWATRAELWPRAAREERGYLLVAEYLRFHPFYRNAAGSLGRAWTALAEGREREWRAAAAEWEEDMATGRALEEASRRLLDEAERR